MRIRLYYHRNGSNVLPVIWSASERPESDYIIVFRKTAAFPKQEINAIYIRIDVISIKILHIIDKKKRNVYSPPRVQTSLLARVEKIAQ